MCSFEGIIILDSSMVEHTAVNRGVVGSSPTRGAFWLHGQVVKTSPFHGGNRGSSPLGTTKKMHPLGCFFVSKGTMCANAHKQLCC